LHFKGVISVPVSEGKRFRMHHFGSQIENEIFWGGLYQGWEGESMKLWVQLAQSHYSICDVGANTGVFALAAMAANPSANVTAIEPVARVFDRLRANERLNDYDLHLQPWAASDFSGEAIIFDTEADHIQSVTVNRNLNAPDVPTKKVTIQTKRLDAWIEEEGIQHIDLMKIDVETHEAEVLAGMGVYLDRFRPTLLIEILDDIVGRNVQDILDGKGYLYFNIDEAKGTIRRVEAITKSDHFNFLICSEEIAVSLGIPS